MIPFAVTPAFGFPVAMPGNVHKTAEVSLSFDDDIAARATFAAVRTAARNVSFTTKAAAAIPTVSGSAVNDDLINKHLVLPECGLRNSLNSTGKDTNGNPGVHDFPTNQIVVHRFQSSDKMAAEA